MIRNKTQYFIRSKQRVRGNRKYEREQEYVDYPYWIEEVYRQKDTLKQINNNSSIIDRLVHEYEMNPSVYLLQQLQRNITSNCKLINEVDYWLSNWREGNSETKSEYESRKNVKKHIGMLVSEQIKTIFKNKQKINVINSELEHNRSFSRSFSRIQSPEEGLQRERIFTQVNYKIENLNTILRRMNNVVQEQGELINRIDENLVEGESKMRDAKRQLRERADRQEGTEQFSFEGKINQAIIGLYLLNVGLIIVFLIKNTLF